MLTMEWGISRAKAKWELDAWLEGYEVGKRHGHVDGLEEGRESIAVEISEKLLLKDWSLEEVVELTGLSPNIVDRLRQQQQSN